MRHTVRGLLIKDKKILLVTGHNADFYWTPGGGSEPGETSKETLRREIREELGVVVTAMKAHSRYYYADQDVENYLIEIAGEIQPGNEITNTVWYSTGSDVKLSEGFMDSVLPKLLTDKTIS
jgi:8-oxo-dGTP pyrophosphatase MutT (NUDIX family)